MGRYRKGTKLKVEDLWIKSGGKDRVITELHSLNITKKNTRWNSDVWATLSVHIFGIANESYKKWLNVVWQQNRRGVRTAVNALSSDTQKSDNADQQLQHNLEHEDHNISKSRNEHNDGNDDIINVEKESLNQQYPESMDNDTHFHSRKASAPPPSPPKKQDKMDMDVDDHTASVGEQDHSGEADDYLIDNDKISMGSQDLQDEEGMDCDQCYDSQWDGVESNNGTDYDTRVDRNTEYGTTKPGPRKFQLKIKKQIRDKIKPKVGSSKLKMAWTNVIYKQFRKCNPC